MERTLNLDSFDLARVVVLILTPPRAKPAFPLMQVYTSERSRWRKLMPMYVIAIEEIDIKAAAAVLLAFSMLRSLDG